MKIRAWANVAFLAAGMGFLLWAAVQEFGCQGADSRSTVISLMAAGSREQKAAYEQVIDAFEKSHPGLRVRLEWGGSGDFFGVMLTRMAGGVPPDVAWMYEFKMPYFARKGVLVDLTSYIAADHTVEIDDFHPKALEVFSFEDKQYGMPITMAPLALFYNKTLFDVAGVAYPDGDWTWQTLRDAAIKLTRRDANGRISCYGLAGTVHWEMMEVPSGKRRLGTDPGHTFFDDPDIIETVEFFTDLVLKDQVAPDAAAAQQQSLSSLFESGKAAMTVTGRWMAPTYNKMPELDYDVAPVPRWKNRARVTYTHAVGFCIPAEAKHREAAWQLVKYMSGTEAQTLLTALGDTVPARLSVLRSDMFVHPPQRPAHNRVFADALDYSAFIQVVDPPLPDFYMQGIQAVMSGQMSVPVMLEGVKRQIDRVVEEEHPRLLR